MIGEKCPFCGYRNTEYWWDGMFCGNRFCRGVIVVDKVNDTKHWIIGVRKDILKRR